LEEYAMVSLVSLESIDQLRAVVWFAIAISIGVVAPVVGHLSERRRLQSLERLAKDLHPTRIHFTSPGFTIESPGAPDHPMPTSSTRADNVIELLPYLERRAGMDAQQSFQRRGLQRREASLKPAAATRSETTEPP
jgi:hypothetical protein